MPVDNTIYERRAATWWDDTQYLSMIRTVLNPARFGYFRRVLVDELGLDPPSSTALDVGCGGGLLAEEFARLGFRVTGIDPSPGSIDTARGHAIDSGLDIDYHEGAGERLPFPDSSFDVVYCCDVLEHVADVHTVLAESARVLRPGGVYLYDTINRTPMSKLVMIKLLQEWELSRVMDENLHDYAMFIRPGELVASLERVGLRNREIVGMRPGTNPITTVRLLRRARRGATTYAEIAPRLAFRESRDRSVQYMGYAINDTGHQARETRDSAR